MLLMYNTSSFPAGVFLIHFGPIAHLPPKADRVRALRWTSERWLKIKNMQGVYFLQSLKNQRYYIGSTINLEKRFDEHNKGLVKAIKYLRPLRIVFFQKYLFIRDARRIEYRLKKLKNRNIIERIIDEGIIKLGR